MTTKTNLALVLVGSIAFDAASNLAVAHCSVDHGHDEANCRLVTPNLMRGKKLKLKLLACKTYRNFKLTFTIGGLLFVG